MIETGQITPNSEYKRILVTGGAGYVGSLLVPALIGNGYEVTVLDWFIFEPTLFSDLKSDQLTKIKGDIRDQDLTKRVLRNCDAVIHLAGMSNDPSAVLNPEVTKDINFTATVNLAKTAKEVGVQRLLIASSASVYGIQDNPATEETVPRPLTIYSQCKLWSEQAILPLNDGNFTVTAVRPATLSGFAPRLRLDLVINNMASQAMHVGKLAVHGGDQYRPNLSVQDMVNTYLKLLESDHKIVGSETYNVSESNLTISEIARRIQAVLINRTLEIETVESNDKRSYWVDSSKAQREWGFKPTRTVEDSIAEIVAAIDNRKIHNPSSPKFRNVEVLRNIDLTRIVK